MLFPVEWSLDAVVGGVLGILSVPLVLGLVVLVMGFSLGGRAVGSLKDASGIKYDDAEVMARARRSGDGWAKYMTGARRVKSGGARRRRG